MNLKETRDNYYALTGSLSTVCRQLAFAGIAVVWIFVVKEKGAIKINEELILPLIFFVAGLACDLLQYIYASAAWGIFNRIKELKITETDTFKAPRYINWPSNLFFWSKAALVISGYFSTLSVLLH